MSASLMHPAGLPARPLRSMIAPAGLGGLDNFGAWRPLPDGVGFALRLNPHRKPVAFATVDALALSLHRRRLGMPIQLFSRRIDVGDFQKGERRHERVVDVCTLHEGQPYVRLGLAFVGGGMASNLLLREAIERTEEAAYRAFLAPPSRIHRPETAAG